MRNHTFPLMLILLCAVLAMFGGCTAAYDDDRASLEGSQAMEPMPDHGAFAELNYYGQWYYVRPHGWVWHPVVTNLWNPFLNGYWGWTEYGWTWFSYDPWGWATCHYGYWVRDFAIGWAWVPDDIWTPASVDWIIVDDIVCWAPRPCPGCYWRDPWDPYEPDVWIVVTATQFCDDDIGTRRVSARFKSSYSPLRHAPPERSYIDQRSQGGIRGVPVTIRSTRSGNREYRRLVPSDAELQRTAKYRERATTDFKSSYRGQRGQDPYLPDERTGTDTSTPPTRKAKAKKDAGENPDKKKPEVKKPEEKKPDVKKPEPRPPAKKKEKKDPETKEPPRAI